MSYLLDANSIPSRVLRFSLCRAISSKFLILIEFSGGVLYICKRQQRSFFLLSFLNSITLHTTSITTNFPPVPPDTYILISSHHNLWAVNCNIKRAPPLFRAVHFLVGVCTVMAAPSGKVSYKLWVMCKALAITPTP